MALVRQRLCALLSVSSAWLKVPRGELAVVWELAAAINVAGGRHTVPELGLRPEIRVRMTGSEAGDAVPLAAAALVGPGQEPPGT